MRMDTCICRAESLHCSAETITTLLVGYVRACSADSVVSDSAESEMDCSPPGSSAHGILQARTVEWVAVSSPGDLPNPGTEPGSPTFPAFGWWVLYQ